MPWDAATDSMGEPLAGATSVSAGVSAASDPIQARHASRRSNVARAMPIIWPPAAVIGELSAPGLACLAVIGAVRPHVGRRCKPIRHVVEGRDGSDVPDVASGEAV